MSALIVTQSISDANLSYLPQTFPKSLQPLQLSCSDSPSTGVRLGRNVTSMLTSCCFWCAGVLRHKHLLCTSAYWTQHTQNPWCRMPCQSIKISSITFAFAWTCWVFMDLGSDSDFHMDGWGSWSATFHALQGYFGAILGIEKITNNPHAGITWFLCHHSWFTVLVEVIHLWIPTIVQQLQAKIPKFSARVCIMQ